MKSTMCLVSPFIIFVYMYYHFRLSVNVPLVPLLSPICKYEKKGMFTIMHMNVFYSKEFSAVFVVSIIVTRWRI